MAAIYEPKICAVRDICAAVFGRNNLIDSDFEDAKGEIVDRQFLQSERGLLIQFCVSTHALGKVHKENLGDWIDTLLGSESAD